MDTPYRGLDRSAMLFMRACSDQTSKPLDLAMSIHGSINVLGTALMACSYDPVTGFFRDGCCETGPQDLGSHTVCCKLSEGFLSFSKSVGNDLSTPLPQYRFPGLKPGDRWCVCASRWLQAYEAGFAPPVILEATHEAALRIVPLEALMEMAFSARKD